MMNTHTDPQHWLRRYGNKAAYEWRRSTSSGKDLFCRPLGLVEYSFHSDGFYYEGRADVNCLLELNIKSGLSKVNLRERILIAWTCLRCQHLLLQARTLQGDDAAVALRNLYFGVDVSRSVGAAIEKAGSHLVFLEDHYPDVDYQEFYGHCQNAARVIDPESALAKAFVMPVFKEDGKKMLRFLFCMAHQISDGLSTNVCMRDFIRCLNEPEAVLRQRIAEYIKPESMKAHLPLPQEALYPEISRNVARQRWFWAIARVLRHVRTPLPIGFHNPLQRRDPRKEATPLPPAYANVLDYSKTPVVNTYPIHLHVSRQSTQRLLRLCKQVKATLGAGIYALSALIMMEFHEQRHSEIPLTSRKAFITGFPLNPRAFFKHHTDPNSCMLAFSDGITLPFLPSDLDLEGRIRLLTRQAQRQLATYQKRAKPQGHDATRQYLTSRGAGLVLANQYLLSIERAHFNLPEALRETVSAQGEYPARMNPTMQTCGVSSIGNREHIVKPGIYDLSDSSKSFIADFHNMTASVRARPGEFLIGIAGDSRGLFATPSIDGTAMDPSLVESWVRRFETILEDESEDTSSRL